MYAYISARSQHPHTSKQDLQLTIEVQQMQYISVNHNLNTSHITQYVLSDLVRKAKSDHHEYVYEA